MNEYTKDYGKVGLTFEHYQQGKAVEELTLVAYQGELYVSLRGTVMNDRIPTSTDDWYKVSTFGDLLDAIRQVKADAEQLKVDIEGIKEEALIVLANEKALIDATLSDINTRATAIIKTLNDTNTSVQNAENLRKQAETLRVEAEAERKRIEAIRVANEALRQDEEGKRVAAEAGRASEFARWQETWAHQQTSIATTIETANAAAARAVEAAQQVEAVIVRANAAADHADAEAAKIQPALDAMDAEFRSKEAQRDAAVAEATIATRIIGTLANLKTAVKDTIVNAINWLFDNVSVIAKHMGIYSKHVVMPLNHSVATNRILTTLPSGEVTQVAKTGWNISRIGAEEFTFGDTAFLKMLSAQGQNLMVEGAVLFASEEEIKDKDGNVIATRLTSLFRASNTDIPESGFVVKTLSCKGKNLLVSHPAEITELVMGRSGVGASMATLEGNLQNEIDEKANLSGFHGAMITGGAISLVPEKADDAMPAYTENLPAARMVGDGGALTDQTWAQGVYPHFPHVPDDAKGKRSSLSFERVEGECLGCNQMFSPNMFPNGTINGITFTNNNDGTVTVNGTAKTIVYTNFFLKTTSDNHKYYVHGRFIAAFVSSEQNIFANASSATIFTNTDGANFRLRVQSGITLDNVKIHPLLLDLTTLFPTPSGQAFVSNLKNNQSSALAVCNKLGYASVITYEDE